MCAIDRRQIGRRGLSGYAFTMKLIVFCALFCVFKTVASQSASIDAFYTSAETKSVIFAIKKELKITCNVSAADSTVEWRKDGKLLNEVDTLKGRFTIDNISTNSTVRIKEGQYNDAGNWSCGIVVNGKVEDTENIVVATTIEVRIKPDNINVVEEEKLRIECGVVGEPFPKLTWKIETNSYNDTVTAGGRITIENYDNENGKTVEDGVLIIDKITKDDRGLYYCMGTNRYYAENTSNFTTMVRVKDKYAALWPFIGICTEVIVLCAIIIIYEKKRNKSELEESDTDQSPDQKNTPDHGKDANLRHRQ